MAAKRYWEVATIRRFTIYVNNWETFGTEGQWPLSEVASIRRWPLLEVRLYIYIGGYLFTF